ncbi:hypothetical protein [Streptomyces sp. ME19-01-6]|uniref:hypothetical protein n=1 Tax=Streptomyces sp. ME19-01-6 TaxID=3028686 RepID=UPI0029ACD15A|nr:hypothetical protein [Streptomyces sp. ME19-01-6]MDX3231672.1 hypothetical protein [Streptomyces sp. ME19-01-6]
MSIDWAALGQVFGISLLVTVGFVGVFTLGIVGTSRKPQQAEAGPDTTSASSASAGAAFGPARAGAYACFALCAAAVAYGISLIVI